LWTIVVLITLKRHHSIPRIASIHPEAFCFGM